MPAIRQAAPRRPRRASASARHPPARRRRAARPPGGALDDRDLHIVAAADYGHAADENLAALRRLVREGTLAPLEWWPREVLELTRWDEPLHERAHWRRAYGEPENHDRLGGENQSLVVLIDSLRALAAVPVPGPKRALVAGLDAPAAAFFAWLIPRLPAGESGEHAFFGLDLLWFALAADVPDAPLAALAEWVMVADDAAAAPWRHESIVPMPGRWLLDTTCFTQRHALWQALGDMAAGAAADTARTGRGRRRSPDRRHACRPDFMSAMGERGMRLGTGVQIIKPGS